ncbi:hypothetical protein AAVH_21541 [Aphelenchoides avenae]|nr:hypothetical protein AAVH_21541 [Aphelenchus avenae]
MHSATDVGSAATSAQECVDLVAAAAPTALAISFDSGTGACKYSTSIYSYYLRKTGQQPSFYLRIDNVTKNLSESDCLTRQDGEYLTARLSFGDEQCVMSTYDAASGLCIVNDYSYDFGKYNAGRLRNDTWYMLSLDQVKASINYKCANEEHSKMIVGGTWYCYGAITLTSGQANVPLIKNNYCAQTFGSGSKPVKITEAREYGYMYYWWPDQAVYLGAYLQSGTTYVW